MIRGGKKRATDNEFQINMRLLMELAKAGTIGLICEPNAIMTLTEYLMDYADETLKEKGLMFVFEHAERIKDQTVKEKLKINIDRIIKGERDLFF